MWQVVKEVLFELWVFFVESILKLPKQKGVKDDKKFTHSTEPAEDSSLLPDSTLLPSKAGEAIGHRVYVAVPNAACYLKPRQDFDTRIVVFDYGQALTFIRFAGEFSEVQSESVRGWVSTSVLVDDKKLVLPNFRPAYRYDAYNEHTERLRLCLKDEMQGGELGLPLQSAEFVLYKLWELKVTIQWGLNRPRLSGAWQTLLRGMRGVQMGIVPRTGAVLECGGSGERAFLGYVEAVHPDSSIVVQSVGRVEDGEFRVEHLSHDEWKEWRPIFISFT